MHNRKNQAGFTLVIALLIVLILAVVSFGGYYVWHTQHAKTTAKTATTPASSTTTKPVPTPASTQKYLTIKEWGVKLPLSATDAGAYYTYSAATGSSSIEGVSIFDTSIDSTTNEKGVNCKDPTYPLVAISRIKPSDVAATQDINNPNYIGDGGPNDFQYFSFTRQYEFAALSSHQAAPICENSGTDTVFQDDTTISAKYKAVDTSLGASYDHMQAE